MKRDIKMICFLLLFSGYATVLQAQSTGSGNIIVIYMSIALLICLTGLCLLLAKIKKIKEQLRLSRTELDTKLTLLENQSEQLKDLDKTKSRFFINISHEFRTPLTLIMGPLEQVLAAKDPDKEIKNKAALMLRNARRLLNLVNQLLELAKFDSGKMQLKASEQLIAPFIKHIMTCFDSMAEQNRVNLVFKGEEHNLSVFFDAEKLEKIITNLLSNAFNYTPAGGKIVVSVTPFMSTGKPGVEISVRDSGAGIPQAQLPHIFERFYRGQGEHDFKRKGTGIGLALTKELVELHLGEIKARSTNSGPDRGTEFILRLPTGQPHIKETPANAPAVQIEQLQVQYQSVPVSVPGDNVLQRHAAKSEQEALVLLVEDNADMRQYISSSLQPRFIILEAADGREGILAAKKNLPDLIISDITMPDTDGLELCRNLKNDMLTSHIPIILLTSRISEADTLIGLESGADDYITKPFNLKALEIRIQNLLELRRQLQLQRKSHMTMLPGEISVSKIDDKFYKDLQTVVEECLQDTEFNVEALAGKLKMSHATLNRKVQALTGKTSSQFIRSYRMKRAAQLLKMGIGSVAEVAMKVGYPNSSYFTRCFKDQFHYLPSDVISTENHVEDSSPLEVEILETDESGKELILVVEDNKDANQYICDSLQQQYQVLHAFDGKEGIRIALETIPDLIVSDVMMPETNGFELCDLLKNNTRTSHIPIILLTAKASEASIVEGLQRGADDYITKPFNTQILQARIKNLIRLRRHLQKRRHRQLSLLPEKLSDSEANKKFIQELNTLLEHNLSAPEFNVEQLAKKLYMSSATLYRKLQALTGEIPSQYLRSFRLKRAAQLLDNNFGSVSEVAFEVGFNSQAYFTRCFKEKFHQLPSMYIQEEK